MKGGFAVGRLGDSLLKVLAALEQPPSRTVEVFSDSVVVTGTNEQRFMMEALPDPDPNEGEWRQIEGGAIPPGLELCEAQAFAVLCRSEAMLCDVMNRLASEVAVFGFVDTNGTMFDGATVQPHQISL